MTERLGLGYLRPYRSGTQANARRIISAYLRYLYSDRSIRNGNLDAWVNCYLDEVEAGIRSAEDDVASD